MKKRLYLPLLFVAVAIGCGQPTAHYEIDVVPIPLNNIEIEQIRIQARQHAAADHKKHNSKKRTLTYHTPRTYPFGASFRIPSHRLTIYSIENDSARAFIYHTEYTRETRRLQKFVIRPRDIALVCSMCLAIVAIIAVEGHFAR